VLAVLLGIGLAGCGAAPDEAAGPAAPAIPRGEAPTAEADLGAAGRPGPLLVALGDSLTAGLGLDVDEAYPARLERALRDDGYAVTVVNAGVSGDTTAAGLSRAEWALEGDVRILILALGGNDGLRGLPVGQMKRNLSRILALAAERGIPVLLAGMEAPPNFGAAYTAEFRAVFADLAREHDAAFMPFLLDGVAADPALNQADGIHPNAEGAAIVATRVRDALEPLLSALAP
jgi:acyl-CoA thioesterase-1